MHYYEDMPLDLNLTRAFLAIYDAGSVTRAAEALSLTQPTVSHALGRLRRQLGDPLFVRGSGGLEPTVRASELARVFRRSVGEIDEAASAGRTFDPRTTKRIFRVCLTDIGEVSFLPAIMTSLVREAPGASVEVTPMDVGRVSDWLAHGEVDAAIASLGLDVSEHRVVVPNDRYVCVLPSAVAPEGARISRGQFESLTHVAIHAAAGHDKIEQLLSAQGVQRRIGLRVHHFSVLPAMVLDCSMAAVVPLQMALRFLDLGPIAIRELPLGGPDFEVKLYWDREVGASGPVAWFLELVADALQER